MPFFRSSDIQMPLCKTLGRTRFGQMQGRVDQVIKQLYEDTDAVWQDGARIKEIFG